LQATGWQATIDGAPFLAERGRGGDYRFIHGAPPDHTGLPTSQTRAIHHLSADASVLMCAPSRPAELAWWRVVLDSVLFTVALLHGYEALHAGAIATPAGAVAITAGSGAGKSTLLTELLSRGYPLLADDVLVLEAREREAPVAHPASPLMTVPALAMPVLSSPQPPETIATVEDERWVAVPTFAEPLALKALVVLDRQPSSRRTEPRPSLSRIESPLASLLDALMGFPDSPERQRARFELASTVASTVGIWRLSAPMDTSPAELADALLAAEL
jgi:hypothetical protein